MALKNSTDRGALERLLLSRLPRKEISALVQSYTQPYRELMSYYRCAMMEVETKFNVLNEELSLQYDRNPIESIKTRLKSPESIAEKLQRRGFPLTVESIEENLNDIAGVRVIWLLPVGYLPARRRLSEAGRYHAPPAQGLHRRAQAQRLPQPAPHRGNAHLPARPEAHDARRGAVPHHLHGLVGKP